MDDPNKKKHDAKLVSQQDHEVDYLKRKNPYVTKDEVRKAIKETGPTRSKVESRLKSLNTRRKNSRT